MDETMQFHFMPRPVVESRWKEKKFVPEVMTADGNFVVGPPVETHAEAETIAKERADQISASMLDACRQCTRDMRKARA